MPPRTVTPVTETEGDNDWSVNMDVAPSPAQPTTVPKGNTGAPLDLSTIRFELLSSLDELNLERVNSLLQRFRVMEDDRHRALQLLSSLACGASSPVIAQSLGICTGFDIVRALLEPVLLDPSVHWERQSQDRRLVERPGRREWPVGTEEICWPHHDGLKTIKPPYPSIVSGEAVGISLYLLTFLLPLSSNHFIFHILFIYTYFIIVFFRFLWFQAP
jgi:hypothetical protein